MFGVDVGVILYFVFIGLYHLWILHPFCSYHVCDMPVVCFRSVALCVYSVCVYFACTSYVFVFCLYSGLFRSSRGLLVLLLSWHPPLSSHLWVGGDNCCASL